MEADFGEQNNIINFATNPLYSVIYIIIFIVIVHWISYWVFRIMLITIFTRPKYFKENLINYWKEHNIWTIVYDILTYPYTKRVTEI